MHAAAEEHCQKLQCMIDWHRRRQGLTLAWAATAARRALRRALLAVKRAPAKVLELED